MKNDKILNFLLAFFITLLIFNLFFPSKKQETSTTQEIVFKAASNSYTIPNLPVINITNNSNKTLSVDTCNDILISKDWIKIENILLTAPKFCTKLNIKTKESKNINFEPISKIFSLTWEYDFKLKINNKEYSQKIIQEEKWFFNNFFSTLFYAPVYNLFVLLISNIPWHSLGLAIIFITLIIRLIILVPQHHILVNGRKMQAIQPKIKEIQEKYKWDQAKIWMELLELYKKEKVNPMWSCFPLLLQLPLLIVLYWIISWITSAANYYYLYSPLKDFDIASINSNFLWLNLIKQEWKSWLILAILIWVAQFIQIKMSLSFTQKKKDHGKIVEKEVKVDDPVSEFMPDPNIMNAFMLWWMPTMLAFSSYFFPSWVGIYWLIWTLFTLVQQYVVNKMTDKKDLKTKEWHEIIVKWNKS